MDDRDQRNLLSNIAVANEGKRSTVLDIPVKRKSPRPILLSSLLLILVASLCYFRFVSSPTIKSPVIQNNPVSQGAQNIAPKNPSAPTFEFAPAVPAIQPFIGEQTVEPVSREQISSRLSEVDSSIAEFQKATTTAEVEKVLIEGILLAILFQDECLPEWQRAFPTDSTSIGRTRKYRSLHRRFKHKNSSAQLREYFTFVTRNWSSRRGGNFTGLPRPAELYMLLVDAVRRTKSLPKSISRLRQERLLLTNFLDSEQQSTDSPNLCRIVLRKDYLRAFNIGRNEQYAIELEIAESFEHLLFKDSNNTSSHRTIADCLTDPEAPILCVACQQFNAMNSGATFSDAETLRRKLGSSQSLDESQQSVYLAAFEKCGLEPFRGKVRRQNHERYVIFDEYEPFPEPFTKIDSTAEALAISAAHSQLVVFRDGLATIHDTASGNTAFSVDTVLGNSQAFGCFCSWSTDGRLLALSSFSDTALIVDAESGDVKAELRPKKLSSVLWLQFLDSERLLFVHQSGIYVFDTMGRVLDSMDYGFAGLQKTPLFNDDFSLMAADGLILETRFFQTLSDSSPLIHLAGPVDFHNSYRYGLQMPRQSSEFISAGFVPEHAELISLADENLAPSKRRRRLTRPRLISSTGRENVSVYYDILAVLVHDLETDKALVLDAPDGRIIKGAVCDENAVAVRLTEPDAVQIYQLTPID